MKLKIENFQSLEGVNNFNFEPGVTIIVGASNSGKTAIIRALRGLILNYVSTSKAKKYITHFKDNLQVDLQLDDKINYSWYKDTKNTLYKIEDLENHKEQEFEKSGNDDLESICDKAGIDFPFVIRDKKLINIYTEKDSLPFPFDLNDVELFKMFEELYNVSSSGIIFKFMKSLETKTNSEVKSTKEQIELDKNKIEKIIELEDKYEVEKLEELKLRAEKIQAGMIGIDEDIRIASKNNKICRIIKEFLDNTILKENTDKLVNKSINLIKESKELSKDIEIISSNNKIEQINVYKKDFNMALISEYNALSSDYNRAKLLNNELKSVQEEAEDLLNQQKEIKEELAKIDVCPLCGSKLKKEG